MRYKAYCKYLKRYAANVRFNSLQFTRVVRLKYYIRKKENSNFMKCETLCICQSNHSAHISAWSITLVCDIETLWYFWENIIREQMKGGSRKVPLVEIAAATQIASKKVFISQTWLERILPLGFKLLSVEVFWYLHVFTFWSLFFLSGKISILNQY